MTVCITNIHVPSLFAGVYGYYHRRKLIDHKYYDIYFIKYEEAVAWFPDKAGKRYFCDLVVSIFESNVYESSYGFGIGKARDGSYARFCDSWGKGQLPPARQYYLKFDSELPSEGDSE